MLTVVALKAWGSNFSGKKIVINCDNLGNKIQLAQ
jgi:hypothetical protein